MPELLADEAITTALQSLPGWERAGDRLVREVERVISATDGFTADQLAWTPTAKDANSLIVLASHTVGAAERHPRQHRGPGARADAR